MRREYRLRYHRGFRLRSRLTLAGVVGVMCVGAVLGTLVDAAPSPHLLTTGFGVLFTLACLAAAALARPEQLRSTVLAVPLVYGGFVGLVSLMTMTSGGSWLQGYVEEVAVQALYSAPGLFFAVGGAFAVAAARTLLARSAGRRRPPTARARLARFSLPD